jgi:nitroreductase
LSATALGLGACAIGAFFDDDLNQLLALRDQKEVALYLISIGTIP